MRCAAVLAMMQVDAVVPCLEPVELSARYTKGPLGKWVHCQATGCAVGKAVAGARSERLHEHPSRRPLDAGAVVLGYP